MTKTLADLAESAYETGAYDRAEKMYAEILEDKDVSANLGAEDSLFFRHMRGVCLKKLGKFDEAIQLLDSVRLERLKLGALRDAYNSQHHVLICRRLMGQFDEAESANRRLLEEQISLLGPEHEDCIATEIEIGRCVFDRGDAHAADAWFADLYAKSERVLGNHSYRWVVLGERSQTLAQLGDIARALPLCEASCAGLTGLLGAGHPASLRQQKCLSGMSAQAGGTK